MRSLPQSALIHLDHSHARASRAGLEVVCNVGRLTSALLGYTTARWVHRHVQTRQARSRVRAILAGQATGSAAQTSTSAHSTRTTVPSQQFAPTFRGLSCAHVTLGTVALVLHARRLTSAICRFTTVHPPLPLAQILSGRSLVHAGPATWAQA